MSGGISEGDLQGPVLVSEEDVDDVLETRSRERVGVPALDHEVIDGTGAAGGRREAIATVHFFYDLYDKFG